MGLNGIRDCGRIGCRFLAESRLKPKKKGSASPVAEDSAQNPPDLLKQFLLALQELPIWCDGFASCFRHSDAKLPASALFRKLSVAPIINFHSIACEAIFNFRRIASIYLVQQQISFLFEWQIMGLSIWDLIYPHSS